MLRNPRRSCKCILLLNNQQQILNLHSGATLSNKNTTNVLRQGKIMGKLFGNRVTGSKKRWIPMADSATSNVVFKQSPFGAKTPNSSGKNAARRITVLNKLFMTHITDLLATGEVSEKLLGKGLQISRVKISQDFAYVNVYWITTGDVHKDILLEQELHRSSGQLRHELSQLGLMGVVPRIKFVKDKIMSNIGQVEALLRNMDFGENQENPEEQEDYLKNSTDIVKCEFYGNKVSAEHKEPPNTQEKENSDQSLTVKQLPEMRHDVLGLDHKGIMLKILTKMRKSKQQWENYQLQQQSLNPNPTNDNVGEQITTTTTSTISQLNRINSKLAKAAENSEKFDAFLAKRREQKNTPERKKYRVSDHVFDNASIDDDKEIEVMSARQRQLFEAEDYLHDDLDDKKKY